MIRLFKLIAQFPLVLLRGLGIVLGWMVWLLSPRYRRTHKANWQTAVESGRLGRSHTQARRLYWESIGQAGMLAMELPKIWCDPRAAGEMKIRGMEAVKPMLENGRGVLFLTPHLGAFELAARALALHMQITVLYRPAKQALSRKLMETLRPTPGVTTAPATSGGVRQLLRSLRRGEAVGILPDQVPSGGEGEWAPFFGKSAYTMTLPIRLAQATGAAVFFLSTLRTRSGWRLEIEPWAPQMDLASASMADAAVEMNRALEQVIIRAPEQYLWAYNRYKQPRQSSAARRGQGG
jgi:Kdo2-lipid IVA lauroyltransferase/acyltransferase